MCFKLFKKHKIPIINFTVAIKTIVNVKALLRNFLVTLSECSIGTFVIVEPVVKFGFCFLLSLRSELHHRIFILIVVALFWRHNPKDLSEFLKFLGILL